MIRQPVLKDLEGARKTLKVGGVAIETRQGLIVAGTFVLYSLVCYYLADLLGVPAERAAVALAWVLPLAFAFAFVKKDGYHLDWWVARKWRSLRRPDVLLYKKANPDDPTALVRDSVQRALPAERFYWEMLRCDDGTYLVAFEVTPVALSLVGDTERGRVYAAARELYNRLDFPVVEMVRSKEGSTARYTRRLRDIISGSVRPEEEKLSAYAARHLRYLEETVPSYNIFERRGYLILPYNPSAEEARRGGFSLADLRQEVLRLFGLGSGARPSGRDAKRRQREAEAAHRVLRGRAQVVYDGFVRMGCRIRALTESELVSFLKEQTTEWEEAGGPPPNPYPFVTLEHGGYELLPEERRRELAEQADAVREEAPIAFAAGELRVANAVAPDAVRILPDRLRVEGRHHATLFVSEFADEVHFGMLEDLTRIEGRVKVVKYVEPRPKGEALKILGAKLAALRAAERTADDGNVASAQQREISRFTNEQAMAELNADRQRYLEVSILVHCEADSEEGLQALVEEVRTTLAGWRTEAKLCREEAWEGFLSTLPLGRNHLSGRYAVKGMLTNPLACLFSYTTRQIDHERGVFLGVDAGDAGVLTLDNRELVNPHSVIVGQSGGGKTFVVKCLSTRQRMIGHRVVIVDPEGNSYYARVAREIGGEFVWVAPGSPHKINPFDLHEDYVNVSLLEDVADDEDLEAVHRLARAAALNGKVQEITRMVSLMISSDDERAEGLSGAEAGYVERAVYESYRRKGITEDPGTHSNEPPTFPDFFAALAGRAGESEEVAALHEKLYSWHSGALSTLFDSQTNVDLTNKYLVFQVSKVRDRQKAPVMHAILEFMNGVLSNPDEPSDCYVDEGWAILAYPMSADFSESMYRSGRARNNAMCFASQNPIEFVESRQGRVILDLSATHMVFRHEHRRAAEATASFYDLSEEETKGLLNLRPGEGYLIADQTRVPMRVMASEEEEALFNTDPKKREKGTPAAPPDPAPAGDARDPAAPVYPEERGSRDAAWRPYSGADGSRGGAEPSPEAPGEAGATRVYAFCGDGAARTAAAVAGLLADGAERDGRYVLAVDAAGGELFGEVTGDGAAAPPDAYLAVGHADLEDLAPHVAGSPRSAALKAVAPPEDPELSAYPLIEAAREVFDVCIVACSGGPYADDWLLEADRVVACSDRGGDDALREAERLESRRGRNGTLLATLNDGPPARRGPLTEPAAGGRPLYTLSDGAAELVRALAEGAERG